MPRPTKPGFYGFRTNKRPGYDIISVVLYNEKLFFSYEGTIYEVKNFPGSFYTEIIDIEDALEYIDKQKEK